MCVCVCWVVNGDGSFARSDAAPLGLIVFMFNSYFRIFVVQLVLMHFVCEFHHCSKTWFCSQWWHLAHDVCWRSFSLSHTLFSLSNSTHDGDYSTITTFQYYMLREIKANKLYQWIGSEAICQHHPFPVSIIFIIVFIRCFDLICAEALMIFTLLSSEGGEWEGERERKLSKRKL